MATAPARLSDRPLPQDLDAERALLGSLVINPDGIGEIIGQVQPTDFVREAHQAIYAAMLRLHLDDRPADLVTLGAQLTADDTLAAAGGADYLTELASAVPTPFHAAHYAGLVTAAAERRETIRVASDVLRQAWDPTADLHAALEAAGAALDRVARGPARRWTFPSLGDDLTAEQPHLEAAVAAHSRGEPQALRTNLPAIDGAGVLLPGELVLLAAEPGVGKTALLLNLLRRYAERGIGVLLVEFEMSASAIMHRLLAALTGTWATKLRTGNLSDDELSRVVGGMAKAAEWPVWRLQGPTANVRQLRRLIRRQVRRAPAQVLLLDYLQLMPLEGRADANEASLLGQVSTTLKQLAHDEDLLIIAVSSTNRGASRSDIDRLRGSGQLGFDADWVLTMRADSQRQEREHEPVVARQVTVSKARHGQAGVRQWLRFDRHFQTMTPIDDPAELDSEAGPARRNGRARLAQAPLAASRG